MAKLAILVAECLTPKLPKVMVFKVLAGCLREKMGYETAAAMAVVTKKC